MTRPHFMTQSSLVVVQLDYQQAFAGRATMDTLIIEGDQIGGQVTTSAVASTLSKRWAIQRLIR